MEPRRNTLTLGERNEERRNSQYQPSLGRMSVDNEPPEEESKVFQVKINSDYGRRPDSSANSEQKLRESSPARADSYGNQEPKTPGRLPVDIDESRRKDCLALLNQLFVKANCTGNQIHI